MNDMALELNRDLVELNLDHIVDVARPALADFIKLHLHSTVRLLVVVDTEISLSPGANAFGIERVIRLLRESTVGCMRFRVDVAQRSNTAFSVVASPTGTNPKYLGFRFDSVLPDASKVISHYDEVWCFGFKPDNSNGTDANINQPSALPASNAELAVLTAWMNQEGGMFATGDHDYLGASMCHRIPRVGTMRAWTNAQNVPPIGSTLRIDTNRPANAAEVAGTEVIEFERQSDVVPQPIDWVPWLSFRHPWLALARLQRPHPVLCHPSLGPINVMPDHPHEGVVFDHVVQPDVGLSAIALGNSYNFGGGVSGAEYPTVSGVQPLPMVIAHGRTLADPPLMHEKGDSPAKRFAMINVYDGHRANVGRVATDSTWHHWMNINITQLEAAGGNAWEKIKRYYLNLAVWLAPSRIPRRCLCLHIVESFYMYPGIEEFRPHADLLDMGSTMRQLLIKWYGPCWVTQSILDWIGRIDLDLRERLIARYLSVPMPKRPFPPRPESTLTCPPPDMLEAAILGGMVQSVAKVLQEKGSNTEESIARLRKLSPEKLDKHLLAGTKTGFNHIQALYTDSLKRTRELLG